MHACWQHDSDCHCATYRAVPATVSIHFCLPNTQHALAHRCITPSSIMQSGQVVLTLNGHIPRSTVAAGAPLHVEPRGVQLPSRHLYLCEPLEAKVAAINARISAWQRWLGQALSGTAGDSSSAPETAPVGVPVQVRVTAECYFWVLYLHHCCSLVRAAGQLCVMMVWHLSAPTCLIHAPLPPSPSPSPQTHTHCLSACLSFSLPPSPSLTLNSPCVSPAGGVPVCGAHCV